MEGSQSRRWTLERFWLLLRRDGELIWGRKLRNGTNEPSSCKENQKEFHQMRVGIFIVLTRTQNFTSSLYYQHNTATSSKVQYVALIQSPHDLCYTPSAHNMLSYTGFSYRRFPGRLFYSRLFHSRLSHRRLCYIRGYSVGCFSIEGYSIGGYYIGGYSIGDYHRGLILKKLGIWYLLFPY